MIQVLIDADNVDGVRIGALLDLLPSGDVRMTVAGHQDALEETRWPPYAEVVAAAGWQRADMVLAAAYEPDDAPLVLVSGDGDFGLLVTRHRGPTLVISQAASYHLREQVMVVDPVVDGMEPLRQWLAAVL
ncbi:MAG TPA: hypothetical protein VNB94_06460 [Mycobacteriales bacterium]|nr:hypothetical protein [Mycobacteriales bacterium]